MTSEFWILLETRSAWLFSTQRHIDDVGESHRLEPANMPDFRLHICHHQYTDVPWFSDTNWVVMDYLVSEGYPGAAEKFAQETNLALPSAPQEIRDRVHIRNDIHTGNIEKAIERINDVDPQVRV